MDKILSELRSPAQLRHKPISQNRKMPCSMFQWKKIRNSKKGSKLRKHQVQLKLGYQIQKLKLEQEGQAQETEDQLRQLEEQKNLEMLKLESNIDEEDENHPANSKKPVVPDGGYFLGKISGKDDKAIWAKTKNLFKHRVTINKLPKILQPHFCGKTVTLGWVH